MGGGIAYPTVAGYDKDQEEALGGLELLRRHPVTMEIYMEGCNRLLREIGQVKSCSNNESLVCFAKKSRKGGTKPEPDRLNALMGSRNICIFLYWAIRATLILYLKNGEQICRAVSNKGEVRLGGVLELPVLV